MGNNNSLYKLGLWNGGKGCALRVETSATYGGEEHQRVFDAFREYRNRTVA